MVQEHVTAAQHREDAGEFLGLNGAVLQQALLSPGQAGGSAPPVRGILQGRQRNGQQAHQVIEAQRTADPIEILRFNAGALQQQFHHGIRHLIGDLQAHHLPAHPSFAQALLQGLHQVVGFQVP